MNFDRIMKKASKIVSSALKLSEMEKEIPGNMGAVFTADDFKALEDELDPNVLAAIEKLMMKKEGNMNLRQALTRDINKATVEKLAFLDKITSNPALKQMLIGGAAGGIGGALGNAMNPDSNADSALRASLSGAAIGALGGGATHGLMNTKRVMGLESPEISAIAGGLLGLNAGGNELSDNELLRRAAMQYGNTGGQ